ncbi:MAG TPA: oligoendopeptidase F, partial [Bacteroidota bacterium]|nr:oligoendopeptidase F [Bacteroidota bacterium]
NDLFPSIDAWKKEKDEMVRMMGTIPELRKNWTASAAGIAALYECTDAISLKARRLGAYAMNLQDMELGNSTYRSMSGELQSIFTDYGVTLSFRNADLLKMDEQILRGYLSSEPRLRPFAFTISEVLRARPHILPEEQAKVRSLAGLYAGSAQEAADLLNNVEIPSPEVTLSNGTTAQLNMAAYFRLRQSKNAADRELVVKTFWENRKKFEKTLAALYDAGMKEHLFDTRVSKFGTCLETRLFDDNIDTLMYHQLIRSVRSRLAPLHRFYAVKKNLLKLDTMRYSDVYASAVPSITKLYPFDEARTIILGALHPLGNDYCTMVDKAFADRWIDIYPNKEKQSGAYSRSVYGVHPYIKMNYDGSYDNVSTLSHELGHAMHSTLANAAQPFSNSGYPTFLAEIASTFNEHLLMDYFLANEKDDRYKLFLLDKYLDQVRGSIYQQTMFAEFELAMHERVEQGQSLTADWLDKTYLQILRDYYGHDNGTMIVGDQYQNAWSSVPHFFYNYYVFQYSTGMIASMALSDAVLHGTERDRERYLTLLKSGGSDFPLTLLKSAGVDMLSPEPAAAALRRFDMLVGEMEKLVVKLNAGKKM